MYVASIALHAAAGLIALVAGLMVMRSRLKGQRAVLKIYVVAIVATVVFLLGAFVLNWSQYQPTEQMAFSALAILGLAMVVRVIYAYRGNPSSAQGRQAIAAHIGFTLISLFDGFVIVLALDFGAPGFVVAIVGVGAVILGVRQLNAYKATLTA